MPRKLYPSEARKIRAMLGEDFSDLEISRALHVARSTVSHFRNGDQNEIREPETELETESPQEPEKKEVNSESMDLERTSKVSQERKSINNEELKQITFVGGKKHEEQEEEELKEKDSKQEEDVYMCDNCNYQQNTLFSKCPKCHYDMKWDEKSKSGTKEEDEYQCYNCKYIQGSPFSDCPKCGVSNDFGE